MQRQKCNSDSSWNSSVQSDNAIAFASAKILKTKKKRFFVLKSVPKASPWELEGVKPVPLDYFLIEYKKKFNQSEEIKRIYNLSSVIFLTRCTKKDNKTVLGICFQDDALFLKFETEEELSVWHFRLSEILSVTRNCRWPELLHCFSVILKPKDLALQAARHGKDDLAGQYRFCLTESAVLLVKEDLLNPTLHLQFRCIRSCVHAVNASFFQLHLGRLSPIGEGVLHFQPEQPSMLNEIVETLIQSLSEASERVDNDSIKSRNSRRNSRSSNSSMQRTTSSQSFSRRSNSEHCSSISSALANSSTIASLPDQDYCNLSCATRVSHTSSTSLSATSEQTESDRGNGAATTLANPPSEESRIGKVSNWQFGSTDASLSTYSDWLGSPGLGSRANSVGSRPVRGCGKDGSYSSSQDKQGFADFHRPRTTSDASRQRQHHQQHHYPASQRNFRPRTGSYGNRHSAHRSHGSQELTGSSELQSLCEAAQKEDIYVLMTPSSESQQQETSYADEDPYWTSPGKLDAIVVSNSNGDGRRSPDDSANDDYMVMSPT